jgi:hypothetical protein
LTIIPGALHFGLRHLVQRWFVPKEHDKTFPDLWCIALRDEPILTYPGGAKQVITHLMMKMSVNHHLLRPHTGCRHYARGGGVSTEISSIWLEFFIVSSNNDCVITIRILKGDDENE